MKYLHAYFRLQLKRAAKLAPQMLLVTLLLTIVASLAALMLSNLNRDDGESKKIVRIGVVGDEEDDIIADALKLLESSDSSRFSLHLELMKPEQANSELRRGNITGYVLVPDGFADALWRGEHRPLTYVSNLVGANVGSQLTRELVTAISAMAMNTENAVYGVQNYVGDKLSGVNQYRAGDEVLMLYATRFLDREMLYVVENAEVEQKLSTSGYYLCGITLLFIMLWSVSCCPFFSRRSREMSQLLQAQGLGSAGQVLSEFASYVLLLLCALLAAGILAGILLRRFQVSIPELEDPSFSPIRLLLHLLPPALMLCSLQFLLYELANSTVSGILLQFLNAAVQGYLAGCFYPSSFFPASMQRFGSYLPAGASMRYLQAQLQHLPDPSALALICGFFFLFLALSLVARASRNRS